jgi:hypothetical protein
MCSHSPSSRPRGRVVTHALSRVANTQQPRLSACRVLKAPRGTSAYKNGPCTCLSEGFPYEGRLTLCSNNIHDSAHSSSFDQRLHQPCISYQHHLGMRQCPRMEMPQTQGGNDTCRTVSVYPVQILSPLSPPEKSSHTHDHADFAGA